MITFLSFFSFCFSDYRMFFKTEMYTVVLVSGLSEDKRIKEEFLEILVENLKKKKKKMNFLCLSQSTTCLDLLDSP